MIAPATFRDRLPSAVAAIALQAGLLAMLLLSLQVVRRIGEEQEHVITLPLLARPAPPQRTVAAPRRKPEAAPPPPVAAQPLPPDTVNPDTAPGSGSGGIQLAQPPGMADCRPENYVRLNGGDRAACAHAQDQPRDDRTMAVNPNPPVKNAPIWQSEIERRNTPPRVPCVSLTNNTAGMGGFAKQDFGVALDVGCVLKTLREGASLLPPVHGDRDPDPPRAHATVAKALQAVNARMRRLYPRPAPPPEAPAGASP